MDPPSIGFVDHESILVINSDGRMRQLFVPFKAVVARDAANLHIGSYVVVEEVRPNEQHRIIYRVGTDWWPYYVFRLHVYF